MKLLLLLIWSTDYSTNLQQDLSFQIFPKERGTMKMVYHILMFVAAGFVYMLSYSHAASRL